MVKEAKEEWEEKVQGLIQTLSQRDSLDDNTIEDVESDLANAKESWIDELNKKQEVFTDLYAENAELNAIFDEARAECNSYSIPTGDTEQG